jgi:signal peptidase I
VQPLNIVGNSMEPNLTNQEQIMVNRLAYKTKDPQRFDVVVFYPDDEKKAKYIKRVIGMPGETIQIKNGETYVNGNLLKKDRNYRKEKPRVDTKKVKIPKNKIFVMGDNRNESTDSRSGLMGPVKISNIVGEAFIVYRPLSHLDIIK